MYDFNNIVVTFSKMRLNDARCEFRRKT